MRPTSLQDPVKVNDSLSSGFSQATPPTRFQRHWGRGLTGVRAEAVIHTFTVSCSNVRRMGLFFCCSLQYFSWGDLCPCQPTQLCSPEEDPAGALSGTDLLVSGHYGMKGGLYL